MEHYITLRAFAEKNGMSVAEAFSLGRKKGMLITINKGVESNIYIHKDAINGGR